jgi:tetratricopeptide (TPR) repeat protein
MKRPRILPVTLIGATAAVLAVAGVIVATHQGGGPAGAGAESGTLRASSALDRTGQGSQIDRNSLAGAIALAQIRLRTLPRDDQTWAQLGSAYVQQGRITVDPSYYPKAQGALEHSLQLEPTGNVAAFVGQGSLANARHEFAEALTWGRRAQAADPYNAAAYGVINDALTQLGDYPGADAAVQKMLDLQPGLSSFSRASYAFEEKGQVARARSSMQRALDDSTDPADIAFCRYYLGELAFNDGDPKAALAQYRIGLTVQPASDQLLAGRAKAEAALGQTTQAVHDYATVVSRVPQPEYVLDYGQLLQSLGHKDEAGAQFTLLASIQQLFKANGVVDDLSAAVFEADNGSAADAVTHARAEWKRRHSVLVADALAWALHRNGQDDEARPYATAANRLGWHNATFAYHLGMIELGLGNRPAARTELARALKLNPHFSFTQAPLAVATLATLEGSR